jgi:hypothetical protein
VTRLTLAPILLLLAAALSPCAAQIPPHPAPIARGPPAAALARPPAMPQRVSPRLRAWSLGARDRGVPPDGPAQAPDRWLAPDKLRHFFLSFGSTGFAFAASRAAGAGDAADWIAPAAAALAGLGKEASDHRRGWGFSLPDLLWDGAGIGTAMLILKRVR